MGVIKTFSEFINESIWSDMQDRSMGKTVRKEDKIITNEELKNRIQKLYKEQGKGETLDVSSLKNCIKYDNDIVPDEFQEYVFMKKGIGPIDIIKKLNDSTKTNEEKFDYVKDFFKQFVGGRDNKQNVTSYTFTHTFRAVRDSC